VFRFAYRLTGNADDAADVAQDTLLAMARSLGTFRGEASLATWLYSVARRAAIRKHRQRARHLQRETPLDDLTSESGTEPRSPGPTPEEISTARERDATVNRALSALPRGDREVLLLRDVEGLTAPEAATVLGIGVRAVKSRVHRARLRLRTVLGPLIGALAPDSPKPGCRHIVEQFSELLDGDIGPSKCAELEAHLRRCSGCRAACQSLRKVLAVCQEAPARELPAALKRTLRQAVRQVRTDAADR
jgi:RNA polymerase sigma-70 factor (ECF subfamily)